MKARAILILMILAASGYAARAASLSDYSEIEVISVQPRSPTIKPLVMAIFTKEQQQRLAAAAFKAKSFPGAERR